MTKEDSMDVIEEDLPRKKGGATQNKSLIPTSSSVKPMDIDNKPVESVADPKKARKKIAKIVEEIGSTIKTEETTKESDAKSNLESKDARKRKERKKKNKEKTPKLKTVDCPDKILELVLAESDFKEPNLSNKLDEIIASKNRSQKSSSELNHRKQFQYEDTIPAISEQTIVMPYSFEHVRVEVEPSAVTQLQCIYHKPLRPKFHRKDIKGGLKNSGKNESKDAKSGNQTNS